MNSKKICCECCGWQGNNFFPYLSVNGGYHRDSNELCPECYSKSRFRLLVRYIKSHGNSLMQKGIRILEIGPVKPFQDWVRSLSNIRYFSVDLENRLEVNAVMDIEQLGFLSDLFDVIICSHVLEHVKDDGAALRELKRVLRDDGFIFIQVPIDMTFKKTVEYNESNPREFGHRRSYGKDFLNRLNEARLKLNTKALTFASELPIEEAVRYGIKKEEKLFLVSKR